MQQIALLEPMNRGFYCGAIGVVWPGSDYVFNVAIRTIEADDTLGTAVFGTGGGITWDSDPAAEYAELLAKAALLGRPRPRFDLLETLRLEDGQYPLLERHIARLTRSAEHLNRYVDAAAVRQRLADVAATCPLELHRVRLTVAPDGSAAVSHVPFPEGIAPWNVKLATEPVDSSDTFLFHKTTPREVYEAAARAHPDA